MRTDASTVVTILALGLLTVFALLVGSLWASDRGAADVTGVGELLLGIGVAAATLSVAFAYRTQFVDRSPKSVRIAMVGRPGVGKTTLIMAMFDEIFSGRVNLVDRRIASQATADSLNANIARLASGQDVLKTTDSELMAYRFEAGRRGIVSVQYRVEIGDFPGEYTDAFAEGEGWIHGTPYFDWAQTADSFVVCVDASVLAAGPIPATIDGLSRAEGRAILGPVGVAGVARETAVIRSAWQRIQSERDRKRNRVRSVVLAFTKADLLVANDDTGRGEYEFDPASIQVIDDWCHFCYADLLGFFEGEPESITTVVTSSFGWHGDGRLGVERTVKRLLPPGVVRG